MIIRNWFPFTLYICIRNEILPCLFQLPKFYYLCEDGVWGVRKACAECFMAVSCSCSLEVRRGELSNLFVNLLCDLSRWVSYNEVYRELYAFTIPSWKHTSCKQRGLTSLFYLGCTSEWRVVRCVLDGILYLQKAQDAKLFKSQSDVMRQPEAHVL